WNWAGLPGRSPGNRRAHTSRWERAASVHVRLERHRTRPEFQAEPRDRKGKEAMILRVPAKPGYDASRYEPVPLPRRYRFKKTPQSGPKQKGESCIRERQPREDQMILSRSQHQRRPNPNSHAKPSGADEVKKAHRDTPGQDRRN